MISGAIIKGKVYNINHTRKGRFSMQVTDQCETWLHGTIVDGVAQAILDHNIRLPGESISVRKSHCESIDTPNAKADLAGGSEP